MSASATRGSRTSRRPRRKGEVPSAIAKLAPAPEPAAAHPEPELAAPDPKIQTGEHPVPQGEARTDAGDTPAPELDRERVKSMLESLVFVSETVVTAAQLGRVLKVRAAIVRELMAELMAEYEPRGMALVEVGNGYQFRSAARNADVVRDFVAQRPVRLTRAQLETLALIAYRQPITRPEIDEVRGVDSGSAMRVLLERDLIKLLGRKDEPGRPLLYGSTPYFLEFFGLKTLKELPTLREFTELNDENRALFKRKTGEEVGEAEAALLAADEAARYDDHPGAHISDEDLAALAAQEDADRQAERTAAGLDSPDDDDDDSEE